MRRPAEASGKDQQGDGGGEPPPSPLRIPQFRWLLTSNLLFFMAMEAQRVVRVWVAYDLTDQKIALGLMLFAAAVPMLIVAPFGGAISDRVERRNLILAGQALLIANEGLILFLLATDRLAFWHLLSTSGLMGFVFPFIMPARQAIVVNIVGKQGLSRAIGLNMAGMNTMRVLGPGVAGYLLHSLGMVGSWSVGLSLYVVAWLCMTRVRRLQAQAGVREVSIGRNILDGVRYMRDNRLVLILLFFGLIPMFLAMPFGSLLVVFARDIWEVGEEGFGWLQAVGGLGGVGGSMYIAWRGSEAGTLRMMMVSAIGFGAFLVGFSFSPWFWLALPLVCAANVLVSIYGTLNNTAIQVLIPDEVRGRVSSFLMMSFSLPLLGTLPMSAVAEAYDAPTAVSLAALLSVGVAVLFYVSSPLLRRMDEVIREAVAEE
jgi:MFS family permease